MRSWSGRTLSTHILKGRLKEEAEKAESERVTQTIKSAVAESVSRTRAIHDWESRLSRGERFRSEPILTVELERIWLQNRPILFIGSIKDIATHDESRYRVTVERSIFGSFDHMFDTELELSLLSTKEQIDSLLKKHPDLFEDYGFNNGVAVVARIDTIRTIYVSSQEGGRDEVKVGNGELIDV